MDCFVSLPFNAAPIATASFDCVTSPPSPGLSTRIDAADTAILQRNLIRSHCAGVGPPLSPAVVRLTMALKLLSLGRGPAHGYAIGREIEERTVGALRPTTGALYQALKRLREDGLIRAAKAEPGADSRRRYFELTAAGRRAPQRVLERS